MAKKYGLHCFGCGSLFYDKTEVHRLNGIPYCEYCHGDYLQSQAEMYANDYEMKEWYKNHPNQDYEQYQIDRANIARYGEC